MIRGRNDSEKHGMSRSHFGQGPNRGDLVTGDRTEEEVRDVEFEDEIKSVARENALKHSYRTGHDCENREHGRDAFARYVADATPLSRFLIETAREGCDLSTPEGRARLAANAQPLWLLLPEGALKRQVLNALADAVQEDARDLLAKHKR